MFPNIDINIWKVGIDWNGNQTLDGPYILEGDQALVFALGGIPARPTPPQCLGFSTNPRNPADATTTDRIGPFFEFKSERLVLLSPSDPTNPRSRQHYSYADVYSSTDGNGTLLSGAPYAYFSSYKTANGYNRYYDAVNNPNYL